MRKICRLITRGAQEKANTVARHYVYYNKNGEEQYSGDKGCSARRNMLAGLGIVLVGNDWVTK